jgi:hypothetical protein
MLSKKYDIPRIIGNTALKRSNVSIYFHTIEFCMLDTELFWLIKLSKTIWTSNMRCDVC